jgi:hypothetical protein
MNYTQFENISVFPVNKHAVRNALFYSKALYRSDVEERGERV